MAREKKKGERFESWTNDILPRWRQFVRLISYSRWCPTANVCKFKEIIHKVGRKERWWQNQSRRKLCLPAAEAMLDNSTWTKLESSPHTFFSRINSSFYVKTPLTRNKSSLYSIDNMVCWPRVEYTTTSTILRDWPIRSRSEHWKRTTSTRRNNNEYKMFKIRVYPMQKYILQLRSVFTMKRS